MKDFTELTVETGGVRLDRYLSEQLAGLSRTAVQRLIDDGFVWVNGVARKASYRVQVGETITVQVPPPEPATPQAENIPLDILYEDDDLLVINKPAGMVVHPAAGHRRGTLVNAILAHCPHLSVGGVERPGIVHRLDSETSGIIVIAKNDMALRELQAQFKARRVRKTYLALVEGIVKPPRGKIDAPIGRDPKHRQRMAIVTRGAAREAVTVYRTLAYLPQLPSDQSSNSARAQSPSDESLGSVEGSPLKRAGAPHAQRAGVQSASADLDLPSRRISAAAYTLIEAEPQTGRTHQIRVHLAFLGFPVVGDAVYGRKQNALGLTRQFLHAWKIAFTLPRTERTVHFVAPLPEDLRAVLEKLGFEVSDL